MTERNKFDRRAACAGILGVGGSLLAAGSSLAVGRPRGVATRAAKSPLSFKNSDFYTADGKFNPDAAKEAFLALLKQAQYPISDRLRKEMWVADFALGRFLEVGMGGMMWINEKKSNYTSLEMFMLPHQTVPEHWHVALPDEGVPVKMESWHVRWGETYTYGEGEPTPNPKAIFYKDEDPYLKVRHETILKVGETTGISRPLEVHWQQAGPEGVIMTETSTYHSGAAVRFTNPKIKF